MALMCHSKCTQPLLQLQLRQLWQLQWYGWQLGTHATSEIATLSNAKCTSTAALRCVCQIKWQLYARHCHMPCSRVPARDGLVGSRFYLPCAMCYLLFVCISCVLMPLASRLSPVDRPSLTVKWRCQLSIWQVPVCGSWQLMWQRFVFLLLPCRLKINQQTYWIAFAVGRPVQGGGYIVCIEWNLWSSVPWGLRFSG